MKDPALAVTSEIVASVEALWGYLDESDRYALVERLISLTTGMKERLYEDWQEEFETEP